ENSIKKSQVAERARTYVESVFSDSKRIKWYLEENLEGVMVEAKIKQRDALYSIKFDTLGTLYDIERSQKFEELPSAVQTQIRTHLKNHYKSFKIRKVQIQ